MSSEAATETVPEQALRRPRRPKRKLNSPVNLALVGILIAVLAYWLGGKFAGDDASSALPAGMPAMTGSASESGGSGFPGGTSSSGDSTQGEITSLAGNTLFVQTSDGNTVKVKVTSNASVTRNAETEASQLHPGDSVVISGESNKAGVVKATDVTATQSGVETAMPSFGGTPPGMSESETAGSAGSGQ